MLSPSLSVVFERTSYRKESYNIAVGQRSLYNVRKGSRDRLEKESDADP